MAGTLDEMRAEVIEALSLYAQDSIIQFSVTVIDPDGDETKWQYAKGSR